MEKKDKNLILLYVIVAVGLVVSNVTSSKLVNLGIVSIPGGVICYAITYLATDVINELWGRKQANLAVVYGLIAQVMASILIFITEILPAVDANAQEAYKTILGNTFFFVLASIISYIVSQFLDVYIFDKIKRKSGKYKFIRNNISTMTSQAVDSILYLSIAFGLGMGWFMNGQTVDLLIMFAGQYVVKFILALLDTPFFYLLTHKWRKESNPENVVPSITNDSDNEDENKC